MLDSMWRSILTEVSSGCILFFLMKSVPIHVLQKKLTRRNKHEIDTGHIMLYMLAEMHDVSYVLKNIQHADTFIIIGQNQSM
jgi:hypothetical protein